ncbi:MAG: hypothetical protein IKD46_05685, partial [Lentisphaeria bacterium]|nr:hypothetical protein [Lentisphaeria bacterium]
WSAVAAFLSLHCPALAAGVLTKAAPLSFSKTFYVRFLLPGCAQNQKAQQSFDNAGFFWQRAKWILQVCKTEITA